MARPLRALEKAGVETTTVPASSTRGLDPEKIRAALRRNTRALVTCHASNVSGAISPIAELGALCRENGIVFILDAAQNAGSLPIDVASMGIDLLAFPGHKGLLGPQGTGRLFVAPGICLATLVEGGTGIESVSPEQPEDLPWRLESGTPNTPGIAGLAAGLGVVLERGVEALFSIAATL